MSLSIDQILQAEDLQITEVKCPEWGGSVFVRTISANQRDAFELKFAGADKVGLRAGLVATALCDEQGAFLNPSEAQVKALGQKASGPLDRIFAAVMRINAMRQEDIEELEKNSAATADADSG